MRPTNAGIPCFMLILFVASASGCALKAPENCLPDSGFVAVGAGMETEFFVALSPQHVEFKPGVDVTPIRDDDGQMVAFRMNNGGNGIQISCNCPGGCKSTTNQSCIVGHTGPNDGFCRGNCETDNSSCFGCGFMLPVTAKFKLGAIP